MEAKKKCCHYSFLLKKYCGDMVSGVDPERKFCAKHRRCVYVTGPEREKEVKSQQEKLIDYTTFKLTCLESYL